MTTPVPENFAAPGGRILASDINAVAARANTAAAAAAAASTAADNAVNTAGTAAAAAAAAQEAADAAAAAAESITPVTVPDNPVGANIPNVKLLIQDADPGTLALGEVWVPPSDAVLLLPTNAPGSDQVVLVKADGSQGLTPLAGLVSGGGGGGTTVSSRQQTARAILASAAGTIRRADLHPAPPTVTTTAGTTSTITGAVRVGLKRNAVGSTAVDTTRDPNWEYLGVRPGKLNAFSNRVDTAIADYLTGGTSQNRRDYWRLRTELYGTAIEFTMQVPVTTLRYRVWVDGLPLSTDLVEQTVTAGTNWLLKVDFGSDAGPHVIELEVNDPRVGGAWVGPTDSIGRYRSARRTILGFGDSHTAAGANGAQVGESWLTWAARHLAMDAANMAIGGSGFFASSANGADFRQRLTPDVVSMAPDLVVFFGGYNDVGSSTAAAVQAEALYCFQQILNALPSTVLIAVGPTSTSQNIAATTKGIDDAVKAAAATAGIPYISLIDPAGLYGVAPAWTASTAYAVGDVVTNANNVWKAKAAFTSGTTFDAANWRAMSFITGTGREGTPTGDGNADVLIGADGIHNTPAGHRALGHFLSAEINRALRTVAA